LLIIEHDFESVGIRTSYTGHERVAKLLLAQNNANPNKPSGECRKPFSTTSYEGQEGVVKLLLAHNNVNYNKLNDKG